MSPRLNKPGYKPLKTPLGEAWIDSGIVWHRVDPSTGVDRQTAIATAGALADMIGSEQVPAVVDIRGRHRPDRRIRKVLIRELGLQVATALIIDSKLRMRFGNAYLALSRSAPPTRLFTSVHEARVWAFRYLPPAVAAR